MNHIVSLSGGLSSAITAERVIERFGKDNLTLWFADTSWEDEELYTFLNRLEDRWQLPIYRHKDGRTPLEVAEEHKIIPNSLIAPCSYELKIKPFSDFIKMMDRPLTVYIGMNWTEIHRMAAPKENYEKIYGVSVDFPLMWKPWEYRNFASIIEEWNIEIPRLYKLGFPHNNCGGRCVKQGISEWKRLLLTFPDRFNEVATWEQDQRKLSKSRSNRSISKEVKDNTIKPITLDQIAKQVADFSIDQPRLIDDSYACFCETDSDFKQLELI